MELNALLIAKEITSLFLEILCFTGLTYVMLKKEFKVGIKSIGMIIIYSIINGMLSYFIHYQTDLKLGNLKIVIYLVMIIYIKLISEEKLYKAFILYILEFNLIFVIQIPSALVAIPVKLEFHEYIAEIFALMVMCIITFIFCKRSHTLLPEMLRKVLSNTKIQIFLFAVKSIFIAARYHAGPEHNVKSATLVVGIIIVAGFAYILKNNHKINFYDESNKLKEESSIRALTRHAKQLKEEEQKKEKRE